jgi:hypothetical protein
MRNIAILISCRVLYFLAVFCFLGLIAKTMFWSGPLFGTGDTSIWEGLSQFFNRQIEFTGVPKVEFFSDQYLFPYGFNNAMQSWGLERQYFHLILSYFFGQGPWLQLYFIASLLITIVGLLIVFRNVLTFPFAALFSFLVVVSNTYLLDRFPDHLNIAVAHWTIIGIALDYVIFREWYCFKKISLIYALFRLFLLVASMGLDLGYVAGYSFTSAFLTGAVILFFEVREKIRKNAGFCLDFKMSSKQKIYSGFMCILSLILIYLYVPILYSVVKIASDLHLENVSSYWVNPVLIFMPWMPENFNFPFLTAFKNFLMRYPEGPSEFQPGLAIVLVSMISFFQIKRLGNAKILLPFIIFMLMCLAQHPSNFRILNLFPWFKYHRVPSRSSLILPLLLFLPMVEVFSRPLSFTSLFSGFQRKLVWSVLLSLFVCETWFQFKQHTAVRSFELTQKITEHFDVIRKSKGEAVFTLPFCVVGGNGVGSKKYCPSFDRLSSLGGFSAFHGKKVFDAYAGRMSESQILELDRAGFPMLMSHFYQKSGFDNGCFSRDEWLFLSRFYDLNDFSGIQIIEDFFSPHCLDKIYMKFGKPSTRNKFPELGWIGFIEKSASELSKVNAVQGRQVTYVSGNNQWSHLNLLESPLPEGVSLEGIDREEDQNGKARWISRSDCIESTIFHDRDEPIHLTIDFLNIPLQQKISIFFNENQIGEPVEVDDSRGRILKRSSFFKKGFNKVSVCHLRRATFKEMIFKSCKKIGPTCLLNLSATYSEYKKIRGWAGAYATLVISK